MASPMDPSHENLPDEGSSWSTGSTLGSTFNAGNQTIDSQSLVPDISDDGSAASSSISPGDESEASLSALREDGPSDEIELPDTVTVLSGPAGGKVYLVGTAHFSHQSNEDVAEVIQKTKPNVVVVELCESRVAILALDEETILEESKNMSFEQIRQYIQKQGLVQGIMYSLLLSMSAKLTRELGMAPGGEFRRAFAEAKRVPGCIIQLGDRPVNITLRRAISFLSLWQKLKMGFSIISSQDTITKEEVEKCKQKDLLQSMLAEITDEYPALSRILVDERDIYLTYSLQLAATPRFDVRDPQRRLPSTVVGVVGIGHVSGIIRNWGKVRDEDIPPLMVIPPQSLSSFILIKSVKYCTISLLTFGAYRFLIPRSIKSIFQDFGHFVLSSVPRIRLS